MNNTSKNAVAIRNTKSDSIKLLNAAEILHNECGIEISDITAAHASGCSATFLTPNGDYNVIYDEDGVHIFKGDSCVFEMDASDIYREDYLLERERTNPISFELTEIY